MDLEELEKEKKKVEEKKEEKGIDFKNAPFVVQKKSLKMKVNTDVIYKNLFRYIGKIQNVDLLQPVPKKKEKVSSYSMFKEKRKISNLFLEDMNIIRYV